MKKSKIIILALVLAITPWSVLAQSSSNNFSIEESYIGPGGLIDSSSAGYQARASLGDTGIGNSASNNFQIYGGYTTTSEEFLELVVTGATIDLGVLTESTTGTGTGNFYVRTYIAQGYAITTSGEAPLNGAGNTLEPMAVAAASSAGTEQFGINLVANTNPTSFGADPVQVPDGTFSFGFAASGYDTANTYKYQEGDVIAQSNSSSGRTDYTISYIANINFLTTEAGNYQMTHGVVATSTF